MKNPKIFWDFFILCIYNKIFSVAKVRVRNNRLDQNINGDAFLNTASQTIFQFGDFSITSNFDGRKFIDYTNELSTFVTPVTLETLNLNESESEITYFKTNNAVLNLDNTDLDTFVKFGSAYEFLKISVQNIIVSFPGSLYVDSRIDGGGNVTFYDFKYDSIYNVSEFKIPSQYTVNNFGLVYDYGNSNKPDNNQLKNINLSYGEYVVWSTQTPDSNGHVILGFTGDTVSRPYLMVRCVGNPFPFITGGTIGEVSIHLKPNTRVFEDFRNRLVEYERYMVSSRDDTTGFNFVLKDPTLLDDGTIDYVDNKILWDTGDGYNIDINTPKYQTFLDIVLTIGSKFDQIKTDLISRFLTPASLRTYDLTDEKKTTKLLRIYGSEYDQLKRFIDSLLYINRTTYDKKKNLPDQIIGNLARTFGWNYSQLVNEEELVDSVLGFVDSERDLNTDLTPAEIDIELWRRILINTNYFWKTKGTRDAIKSMFLLVGIPEPFINITEYIYTVDGRIDPRNVHLTLTDLPSASLPYDNEGYPIAPKETSDFYFQISGDSDSGQEYMNNFRNVGFNLMAQVDNKKSWVEDESVYRRDDSSPSYYQKNSKLVLNTKEVDVALDTSRGIEYDVYKYVKEIDFPANSSGYTLPYNFINVSLDVPIGGTQTFTLPDFPEGDIEVRFNGLELNSQKYYDGTTVHDTGGFPLPPYANPSGHTEYVLSGNTFTIFGIARNDGTNRDVIEATYLYKDGVGISQITVKYIVVRIDPDLAGTIIPLPDIPDGDVQLTINGIAATRGSAQLTADYIINPNNKQELVVQNPDLIAYLASPQYPYIQVAFITVSGSSSIYARSEISRMDSVCNGKIYFNGKINKAVYRLNYKVINPENVKILVDGIALEPNVDYTVNPNNPYEVYLPPGINLGSVVSAYYVVGDSAAFNPIIGDGFGLGDISNLSFLEFIELIQKRLVNATNRKVITNFKGGWYPTLFKVYTTYLKRTKLNDDDPLKSNGYTFENLYPFLKKYNAFFQRFVDQLLPTTIIQKKGGLLIRNTIFTKQKFTYKRGVSFDKTLNYYGDDGATYLKRPYSQDVVWTDDFVCIKEGMCDNFVVNGVEVVYGTPPPPLPPPTSGEMLINNFITVENPLGTCGGEYVGESNTEKYRLEFNPLILPDQTVNVNLNFDVDLNTLLQSTGTVQTKVNIYIYVNGNLMPNPNPTQVTLGTYGFDLFVHSERETYTPTYNLNVNVGDNVEVWIQSIATSSDDKEIYSDCVFAPTVESVTPNGEINVIVPSQVNVLATGGCI